MALLTREQILQADDLRREQVAVPEWGGEILVWELTGAERAEYEVWGIQQRAASSDLVTEEVIRNYQIKLISLTVKDENGKRLFESPEDVEALRTRGAGVLNRIYQVAQRLSALTQEDVETLAGK